ncbi:MAG: hypothetical protein M1818_002750 [Claussenomyces sp. TS43310]|nr:MAG: hypothetical protein M1818_002750 [Claussenomyces sp. TS43310]
MSHAELKKRRRADYDYVLEYRLRWSDNDMYDHMNNSIYYFLYDSVINSYLIENCGLNPPTSPQHGLMVHSESDFFGAIAFPAIAELGLRIKKLGKSSVTYEVALFERGVVEVKSVAQLVHVFVNRSTGRPTTEGMNSTLRNGLQKILAQEPSKL